MAFSLPLIPQGKTLLLVGEEGVSVYAVRGSSGVHQVDFLLWMTPDFQKTLHEILVTKCPRGPIVIFYDMVEQHYRKEKLPRLSALDKAKVVKRKLGLAFPSYKMVAALPLKKGRDDTRLGDEGPVQLSYLFVAVPTTELLSAMMAAVVESGMPIKGMYLLPVEGVGMITKLLSKVPALDSAARWTMFIGHHSSGNLRQIVVKDGNLALTRMTPFSEQQTHPDVWIRDIYQEYKVSISYLSRLGYKASDGLNLVIIGPESVSAEATALFAEGVTNLSLLSVDDVATVMGLKLQALPEEEFADILYAGWGLQSVKKILPLNVDLFAQVQLPRMVLNAALIIAALMVAWYGYQGAGIGAKYIEQRGAFEEKEMRVRSQKIIYNDLLAEQKTNGFDIELYKGVFDVKGALDGYMIDPFEVLRGVSETLAADFKLNKVVIKHGGGADIGLDDFGGLNTAPARTSTSLARASQVLSGQLTPEELPVMVVSIHMSFNDSMTRTEAQRVLGLLVNSLEVRLPEYKVSLIKALRDRTYDASIEGVLGARDDGDRDREDSDLILPEENEVIIEISGGAQNEI